MGSSRVDLKLMKMNNGKCALGNFSNYCATWPRWLPRREQPEDTAKKWQLSLSLPLHVCPALDQQDTLEWSVNIRLGWLEKWVMDLSFRTRSVWLPPPFTPTDCAYAERLVICGLWPASDLLRLSRVLVCVRRFWEWELKRWIRERKTRTLLSVSLHEALVQHQDVPHILKPFNRTSSISCGLLYSENYTM